jgi:DNA-binding NarL/FixJ family response regulator
VKEADVSSTSQVVAARLDIVTSSGVRIETLEPDRITLGKAAADVQLADSTVSRLHAAIERVTGGWVIQDLGSRNGTFVNGAPVVGPRALRSGDELRCGRTRMVFIAREIDGEGSETTPLLAPPRLTAREKDLLVALCRPLLGGSFLAEPASTAQIAAELVVSESAVKKLLGRTYDKFGLVDDDRRRGRLASEALRRGAVSLSDLRSA